MTRFDPAAIARESILRRLSSVVPADLYALFDLGGAGGHLVYDTVTVRGDLSLSDAWRQKVPGARTVGPWNPSEPGRWAGRFASGLEGGLEKRMLDGGIEGWNIYYLPFGLRFQRRVLLYEHGRFVGWLGAIRTADRAPFSRAEDQALARALPGLAAAVREEAWSRAAMPVDGSFVTRSDGAVEWATEPAEPWLHAHREHLPMLAHQDAAQTVWGGAVLSRWRMRSEHGEERWLWTLRPVERPTRGLPLTKRQLEVATSAASGATIRQIAASLDIGDETVRTHLKAIYAELGVTNRLELAERLRVGRSG